MDKCREAFERFECEKYEANYDDMKKNWDWYESQFGYRYSPDSLRGKDWAIWQEAWQHQQAKVEELQKQLNEYIFVAETLDEMYVKEVKSSDELQKRVDAALQLIPSIKDENDLWGCDQVGRQVELLEQALKGEGQ